MHAHLGGGAAALLLVALFALIAALDVARSPKS